ncbi:protein-disulfide reductase DsbD domain-containing protein [Oceanicola sp. S124]|uniref:protein-disulfide reductase DsbD domain-containing protein n=1 Tax=Oceanicola sp. S124 TaxID=1042378 RepID=UPI0002559065|nr:protein-disulfide reductase DsbD domain-containing protein [Oceanicola sp. S124]
MIRRVFRLSSFLSLLSLVAGPLAANPYDDVVSARVLPGWRGADGAHVAGLELVLEDGWKTYWRVPGSAGIPPVFNWAGSDNLSDVEIVWPRPDVFDQGGLRSYGYHDRVILPLRIAPKTPGAPIALRADVFLGVCKNVCVPLEISFAAELPAEGAHDPRVAAALAGRPYTEREGKVRTAVCHVSPDPKGMRIQARLQMPSAGGREVAVIETPWPEMMVSDSVTRRDGGMLIADALIHAPMSGAMHLDRSALTITVLGQSYAVEIQGCDAG